ncbi:MAG: DUF6512 family protein [Promethearchaeota archaeon]
MNVSNSKIDQDLISAQKHQYNKDKKVLIWEVFGIFFITIIGSLFHFVFEWLGHWGPIGGFFPVNESVWEHLKLPFWSILIFTLIEYNFIKNESKNVIFGKAIASLISIMTIIVVFYSYTSLLNIELLVIDIFSFIIGIVLGQLASYKIITREKLSYWFSSLSWTFIILLGFTFLLFTYFPPKLPIFQDSTTGLYGILDHIL